MTHEEEIRLLRKEIEFLDTRWAAFKHHLRTVEVGRITAVINGLSSPHYAHFAYLMRRREQAIKRLRELQDQCEGGGKADALA